MTQLIELTIEQQVQVAKMRQEVDKVQDINVLKPLVVELLIQQFMMRNGLKAVLSKEDNTLDFSSVSSIHSIDFNSFLEFIIYHMVEKKLLPEQHKKKALQEVYYETKTHPSLLLKRSLSIYDL